MNLDCLSISRFFPHPNQKWDKQTKGVMQSSAMRNKRKKNVARISMDLKRVTDKSFNLMMGSKR